MTQYVADTIFFGLRIEDFGVSTEAELVNELISRYVDEVESSSFSDGTARDLCIELMKDIDFNLIAKEMMNQ